MTSIIIYIYILYLINETDIADPGSKMFLCCSTIHAAKPTGYSAD